MGDKREIAHLGNRAIRTIKAKNQRPNQENGQVPIFKRNKVCLFAVSPLTCIDFDPFVVGLKIPEKLCRELNSNDLARLRGFSPFGAERDDVGR